MSFLHKEEDKRIDCWSIMTEISVDRLLALVSEVYENRGGLENQRSALKTKTAMSIRRRLVSDLSAGAVIPPIVIGILADKDEYDNLVQCKDQKSLLAIVEALAGEKISIIDGMQRTTAFLEATRTTPSVAEHAQRVEFWVAEKLNSLIYRMLVLNTGQVPWEIERQLETIYSQLLSKIRADIGSDAEIFAKNENRRRREAAQFQGAVIVRLFLHFSVRKIEFDVKDKVAEDFARLDAIEASSHANFIDLFIRALKLAVELDVQFARFNEASENQETEIDQGRVRFSTGKDIFQSFPALVGFFVAIAIELFDEPGFEINWDAVEDKMSGIESSLGSLIDNLVSKSDVEIAEFLELGTLNERLAIKTTQVGRFERELFRNAFKSAIANGQRLPSLAPCWVA